MDLLLVVTTLDSEEAARAMATALVAKELVACAQITKIRSIYRWQGDVLDEPEFRLLLKTSAARYDELRAAILAGHPYDVPAIYAVRPSEVDPRFDSWVSGTTRPVS